MEKHENKFDINKIDLDKEKDKVAENPGLISFPHTIGSAVIKPEDMGKVKGRALAAMREQSERQVAQLYQQMQVLVAQANEIKRRVEVSESIYKTQLNFEPIIGHIYYLYEKKDGGKIVSMVSPVEWGRTIPFSKYLATVKLLSDHTWEILDTTTEEFG